MTHSINADTAPTRVRALHCDWRSTWEQECEIRKTEFAKRNPDWDRVVATYERVGALLGICPLQWIHTLLHYRGSLEMPCGLMDEVPCVYIVFCAELKAIYVGSRGASHYHTRRWDKKLSVQGGRCLLHRIKEHIGKMRWVRRVEGLPRGAWWSDARMYSLMSSVGIEWWVFIPWICTSPDACYPGEMFWIRRTPVPLNTLRPHKGAPASSQLLRGGLVPPEKFDPPVRSQVRREIDCQRSSLPAK